MTAKGRDTKPHVGIFGKRNVGKSSLINALVGQDIAIVSEIAGTTTDPVKKSIEIHGLAAFLHPVAEPHSPEQSPVARLFH